MRYHLIACTANCVLSCICRCACASCLTTLSCTPEDDLPLPFPDALGAMPRNVETKEY